MRRLTTIAALAVAALAATASSGAAASPAGTRILGVVPHAGALHGLAEGGASSPEDVFLQESPCSPPLCWVMRTNRVYAIYWVPSGFSVQTGYETAVNRYLTDVAAASGSQTSVYSVATQYYDATGFIGYQSTFGGSYLDTDPFPANGCTAAPTCLTDQQLEDEIQHVLTVNNWQPGPDVLFLLMTPDDVGSCYDGTGQQCSTNFYCAYHSGFVVGGQPVLYANEPYAATISGCNSGPSPNGDDADAVINTLSHEQNEAITDPWGNAWLNSDGDEIADLCAWKFGTPVGGTGAAEYNQVINGDHYALQEDYSNDGSTCLQHYVGLPANTVAPSLSGLAVQGQTLSVTQGSWTQEPTGYAYEWLRCRGTGANCTRIPSAASATYVLTAADSGHIVKARVSATNSRGTAAVASNSSASVVGIPVATKPPKISGKVKVGKKLTASRGTWTGPPQTYRVQWLRCNGGGSSCHTIKHATKSKYKLTKKDAKHRLRVRVTASNAVGKKAALSRATAKVPATKKK